MTIRNALILSLLLAACQTSQTRAAFTVTEYSIEAKVNVDGAETPNSIVDTDDYEAPHSLPATLVSATSEDNSSETAISWTLLGDSADLKVSFSHALGSAEEFSVAISSFTVLFRISTPSILTVSGSFLNSDGTLFLNSSLDANGTPIFNSTQMNSGGSDSFVLGIYFIEPLSPESPEPPSYSWIGSMTTLALASSLPVSVSGELLLSITPVPEAASFIVWSVSLAMMCSVGGRHRSKARVVA